MDIRNINLDDNYINEKIEKCKELYECNSKYKKILISIENIEEWIENKLKVKEKSKVEELKNLITELGRIEKNVVYKIGSGWTDKGNHRHSPMRKVLSAS